MSIRGTWRRFRLDLARLHKMNLEIREASDATYAKVFGRFGTDEERDAFHRKFNRMLRDEMKKQESERLADIASEIDEINRQSALLRRDLGLRS